MRFWEDMQSKWGFNDGDAIPEGVEAYRTVYIQAVNHLAEQLNSQVRTVAYNRFGMHNFCLILLYHVNDLKNVPIGQYTEHVDIRAQVAQADDAMREAISQAYEADVDNLVHISVKIDPNLDEFIKELKPIDDDAPLILTVQGEPQHIYPEGQVQVIAQEWLTKHKIEATNNIFTVSHVYHRDALLTVRTPEGQHETVPAHLVQVIRIPNIHCADSKDQSPIPPYRIKLVQPGEQYTGDTKPEIAEQYFNYSEAEAALKQVHELTGGIWEIVNGYGNTCRITSKDNPL